MTVRSDDAALDLVICTYDHAALLDRTLAALADQRVPDGVRWSVLVVDNNSSDDTPTVVERHRAEGRIPGLRRVIETRQGLTPARWRGARETAAPWIAFVDDDCLLAPDWVAAAARFAGRHPGCGAFGGRIELEFERPPPALAGHYGWALAEQDHGPQERRVDGLAGAGMVLRRDALAACGWMDEPLLDDRVGTAQVSGGDVEIGLRIAGAGYELWYTPACRLRHLIPPGRTTRAYLARVLGGLGASAQLGDALLWTGSFRRFLAVSAWRAARASATTARLAARAAAGRADPARAALDWSFHRGRWGALVALARMDAARRAALLGRARRTG